MRLAILSIAIVSISIVFTGQSYAAPVVTTDTVELNLDTFPFRDVQLTVKQTPAGDSTSIWFDLDVQTRPGAYDIALSNFSGNVDEGSAWYLVREGDIFTNAAIDEWAFVGLGGAAGAIQLIDFSYHSGSSLSSPSFYLAFATSETGTFFPRNVFGWVHLRMPTISTGPPPFFPPLTVEILGSATAYGASGIVIGSLQAVPEPSSLLIGAMGLLAYGSRRRVE